MPMRSIVGRLAAMVLATQLVAGCSGEDSAPDVPPPPPPAGFANTFNETSPLSSNLAVFTYFTAEYPFANIVKQGRSWVSGNPFTGAFDDGRSLNLDPDFYPQSLASDQIAISILLNINPVHPGLGGRRYVVRWDGEGELGYVGAVDVLETSGARQVIRFQDVPAGSRFEVHVRIQRTTPGNHLRNLRIVPEGGICESNPLARVAGATDCAQQDYRSFEDEPVRAMFNPEFLDGIKHYRALRFMWWQRIPDSPESEFSARARLSHAFWETSAGVPLEAMTALVNLMDMDGWFCLPQLATDDYARQFATMLRDGLEPGRRVYIEYSNEVWNAIYTATAYARDQGRAMGFHLPENDDTIGMLRFYSWRSQRIFDIFEEVFGGTQRLVRVMANFVIIPFFTETILAFEDAAAKTDAFAVAPYFGMTIFDQATADEILRLGADGVFDWLVNDNNPSLPYGSLQAVDRAVQNQVAVAASYGVPLISYEGGQHFLAAGAQAGNGALTNLLDAVNRDPRMRDVYLGYFRNWRTAAGTQFFNYLHSDRWSSFVGYWGVLEYQGQPRAEAPKFDGVMTYIEQDPMP